MEEYSTNDHLSASPRANLLYSLAGSSTSSVGNHHHQLPFNTFDFHLQSGGPDHCFQPDQVKTEFNNFHFPLMRPNLQGETHGSSEIEAIKAKIIAHPHYSNVLQVYMDCQKVGAPPEVAARLAAVLQDFEARQRSMVRSRESCKDPELDQFMEAFYDMLVKYRVELTRPVQEAMDFMRSIETQLNTLCDGTVRIFSDDKCENNGSSVEDEENSGGETEVAEIDPQAEDRELKSHLLKKYSEKLALAEATGLDQKQINNWFINQRKRHWKPSEDMQFMVMDGHHTQNATLYMDAHYLADGQYRLGP
ncbi:hypothetical protein Fmac_000519 [Flemingia macrophylla]|uniref:Homeobox domain-containing protein n=1 Tax=Flemingia macrophylla TaxID=520843 RepID=A0ABD1NEH8_9FABA